MKNGMTLTMIFEAESANYGEGIGNITSLKKITRSDGNMYTYISRQAMRYNIVQQMNIDNTPVSDTKGVVQFIPSASIEQYPEIDLFGYMKTKGKTDEEAGGADTRSAVVRLSNAISMEPYNSDMDFLTNMGLANRNSDGSQMKNSIAQSEIHHSLYSYTVAIDLDRVGEDGKISINSKEKANRIVSLLETLQFLYRDIKGRRENLAPIFVVGGMYNRKCPYFEGRCKTEKANLDVKLIEDTINSCDDSKENTLVGVADGIFENGNEIYNSLKATSVSDVFNKLKGEVEEYYA